MAECPGARGLEAIAFVDRQRQALRSTREPSSWSPFVSRPGATIRPGAHRDATDATASRRFVGRWPRLSFWHINPANLRTPDLSAAIAAKIPSQDMARANDVLLGRVKPSGPDSGPVIPTSLKRLRRGEYKWIRKTPLRALRAGVAQSVRAASRGGRSSRR
jgi:hypothetical protein